MTPFQILRRKVLCEYLDKYPKVANLTLARIVYRDHPEIFESIEKARAQIRVYRGAYGKYARETMSFNKYFKNDKL